MEKANTLSEEINIKINQTFTDEVKRAIVDKITLGYTEALQTCRSTSYLAGKEGIDALGYLRRIAIDSQLSKLTKTYNNIKYKVNTNEANNFHYTNLVINGIAITVSHVAYSNQKPRNAKYRDNLISANYNLFTENNNEENLCFTITHGGQGTKPEFIRVLLLTKEKWAKVVLNLDQYINNAVSTDIRTDDIIQVPDIQIEIDIPDSNKKYESI